MYFSRSSVVNSTCGRRRGREVATIARVEDIVRSAGVRCAMRTSRKARRFSAVFSTPTERSRFPTVGTDSSAARMPNPRREMSFAVFFISSTKRLSRSDGDVMRMPPRDDVAAVPERERDCPGAIKAPRATAVVATKAVSIVQQVGAETVRTRSALRKGKNGTKCLEIIPGFDKPTKRPSEN